MVYPQTRNNFNNNSTQPSVFGLDKHFFI